MRTLHGTLKSSIPKKTLSRYTLRVAKENAKISYVGDWTSYNYRKKMKEAGYNNGDLLLVQKMYVTRGDWVPRK